MSRLSLDPAEQEILDHAVHLALQHAAEGLSGMIGRPVRLEASRIVVLSVDAIEDELALTGGSMVAIYLSLMGEWSAQVMLILEPDMAHRLVDLLLGQSLGTTAELDEMGESALKEVGNVMGAFFAGTIADLAGTLFVPSTPALAAGAVRALLDERLAEMAARYDSVLLIETRISEDAGDVSGYFVVLPDPLELQRLVAALQNRQ